jgi:hypothetical protein
MSIRGTLLVITVGVLSVSEARAQRESKCHLEFTPPKPFFATISVCESLERPTPKEVWLLDANYGAERCRSWGGLWARVTLNDENPIRPAWVRLRDLCR